MPAWCRSAQWRAWSICPFLGCSCPCPLIRWRSHHTLRKRGARAGGLSNLATGSPVMSPHGPPDSRGRWEMRCGLQRVSLRPHCQMFPMGIGKTSGVSRLAAAKRRLLRASALGALASSGALTGVDAAWGQISETLPEVTVSAPRPVPRPPRRPTPAPRRAAPSPPETSEPAAAPAASALPAFQVVAPTPLNQNNQPIPCPPGGGNTCATTPWGTVDRTFTKALTTGASLQGLNDDKVLGHDNYFVIGASVDRSKIGFLGNSELGFIYPDLFVGPNAAIPGTGQ